MPTALRTRLPLPLLALSLLFALSAAPAAAQSDVSVIGILSPTSGCSLTATETVTIRLFNYGSALPSGTAFTVSYSIDSGTPVTEMVILATSLLSNSTLHYSFTTQADLSAQDTFTLSATCSLPGDVNPTNDSFTGHTVTNTVPSGGGTVSGPSSVCASGNSGNLSLSGQTGSVLRWESSTDGGGTWIPISNTTTTQSYTNLAVPTQYRAVAQNGSCPPATSPALSIAIDAASVGGTISDPGPVCTGSNSGTLTLSGKTGSVIRWEFSIDSGTTWINIANTTTSLGFTNLTTTRLYRALVQNGACAATHSATATVTVSPASVGGSISPGSQTVCSAGSGTLTLSGQVGGVVRWESSVDAGITWNNIANTTTTLAFAGLTSTRHYRARVQSAPCAIVFSAVAVVTVTSPAVISQGPAGATACEGEPAEFHVVSPTPSVTYRWQVDSGTGFSDLNGSGPYAGVTSPDLSIGSVDPVLDGNLYRCVVTAPGCTPTISAAAVLDVLPLPARPGAFTTASPTVYRGDLAVPYGVPADGSVTAWYWFWLGDGATVTPLGNEAKIDFSPAATSGTLAVVAENGCGTGPARYLAVTVAAAFPGEVPGDQAHGAPLFLRKNPIDPAKVDLTWGAGCGTNVVDYAVFEGGLGGPPTVSPVSCTSGAALSYPALVPAAGDRLFLVAPLSSDRDGSAGRSSSGVEVPRAVDGDCRSLRNTTGCP